MAGPILVSPNEQVAIHFVGGCPHKSPGVFSTEQQTALAGLSEEGVTVQALIAICQGSGRSCLAQFQTTGNAARTEAVTVCSQGNRSRLDPAN